MGFGFQNLPRVMCFLSMQTCVRDYRMRLVECYKQKVVWAEVGVRKAFERFWRQTFLKQLTLVLCSLVAAAAAPFGPPGVSGV